MNIMVYINYNYIIIAEHSAAAFECAAGVQPDWEVIQRSTIQTEVSMSSLVLTLLFVIVKCYGSFHLASKINHIKQMFLFFL